MREKPNFTANAVKWFLTTNIIEPLSEPDSVLLSTRSRYYLTVYLLGKKSQIQRRNRLHYNDCNIDKLPVCWLIQSNKT